MSIIDDLKRLERAGSNASRTTQKLRRAVHGLAGRLETLAVEGEFLGVELPRGYVVNGNFLESPLMYDENVGAEYREAIYPGQVNGPSREVILRFARDVSEGWLDELAAFLEQRASENEAASVTLENAE